MRRSSLTALFVVALAATMGWANIATAQRPVALITDIVGAVGADVGPFDEISAGASIDLGSGGRLEFQHYQRCETVVVEGGRVNFSRQAYTTQKGRILDVRRSKCPKTVAVGMEVSGVQLRNVVPGGLRLTTKPSFVIVGAKRAQVARLRVREGKTVIFEGRIDGWRFTWPEGTTPLTAGSAYDIDLLSDDGKGRHSLKVTVAEQRGSTPLTLIRVE